MTNGSANEHESYGLFLKCVRQRKEHIYTHIVVITPNQRIINHVKICLYDLTTWLEIYIYIYFNYYVLFIINT